MTTVTLAPAGPVNVLSGQTVVVFVFVPPGDTVAVPAGWEDGGFEANDMYGTEACATQVMRQVAAVGFTWPTVAVTAQPIAWTWYVGDPTDPIGGYSWPQSATVVPS